MWWKFALTLFFGMAIGVAATWWFYFHILTGLAEVRADYVPGGWNSEDREWPSYSRWLQHGGRKLLMDAAFTAAEDGMNEDEVRATFGPPDLVIVGSKELEGRPGVSLAGAGGVYFYKVGRFAQPPAYDQVHPETFAIVFDESGRVFFRLGQGLTEEDVLSDIDTDTRSERRIVLKK